MLSAEAAVGPHNADLIAVFQEFIREGCLHKLTRKGLQQRMFFLVGGWAAVVRGTRPARWARWAASKPGAMWGSQNTSRPVAVLIPSG